MSGQVLGKTVRLAVGLLLLAGMVSVLPYPAAANNVPGVAIIEPAHGQTVWGVVHVWVCAWDLDGNGQIQNTWVRIDSGGWHNATYDRVDAECSWWVYAWDTTQVGDGWHAVYAIAWDGQNHSEKDVIEVLVDNVKENHPPNVEIVEPKQGETVGGVVEVWVCAWDLDGNGQIEQVRVRIDHGAWHNATFVNVTGECSWWVYEWDTTQVEDGEHHIFAIAWDGQDDSRQDIVGVIVDNVKENHPPGVKILHPKHGATVSGLVKVWVCAWDMDGNEQIENVFVRIDLGPWQNATFVKVTSECSWWVYEWDTTQVEDGWHAIYAQAWDGTAESNVDVIEVLVDNVKENHPPNVEIVEPKQGETVSGVVEVWVCAWDLDGNEQIENVWVRIDNSGWHEAIFVEQGTDCSWWVYEWDTTQVEDGEHHIFAIAWDGQDHSQLDVIGVIVDNVKENHPPNVEIVKPAHGATVRGVIEVLVCAWDPDGNEQIEHVRVKIDHGAWHDATFVNVTGECSWWVYEWDTTQVEDGWHAIYAQAWDGTAESNVDVIEVLVDNVKENHPPNVEIMHPEDGATVRGTIEIRMCAWDADGNDQIERVWVRIDGGDPRNATFVHVNNECSWWVYEWDTTQVEDGWHLITAAVWDGMDDGHHSIEVYVDNVDDPPKVDIVHPRNGQKVQGIILVHGEAFDDRGVEAVHVRIDDGEWQMAVDTSPDHSWRTWAFQWDTTEVENGEHTVWAVAWDGNQESDPDHVWVVVKNPANPHPLGAVGDAVKSAEIPISLAAPLPMLAGLFWGARRRKGLLSAR